MQAAPRTLDRKLAVVTGGSSGIGAAAVEALAARGATVVFSYRDAERSERVAGRVREAGGDARPLPLDLERRASIEAFAREVLAMSRPVDVLVQNAGAVHRSERRTEDGLEAQAAVIHHGPLLLTHLLAPALERPARIVDVVSDLHRRARERDLVETGRYGFVAAYARAELRKVLVSRELARRLAGRGVDVHCVHPGGVRTRLFRDLGGPVALLFRAAYLLRMSPESGARAVVHAACELPPGTTGAYVVNGRFGVRLGRVSRTASDEALARRVYEEDARRAGVEPFS